jgi:cytochrome c553
MRRATPARISATLRLTLGCGMALSLLSPAAYGADIEYGRYLSSECTTCHGASQADSTIPNIHGLDQAHIAEVIKAYRTKALPNPVMQNVAGRLGDEEIAALAAYFATAKRPK